jgi:hypothetical protein
LFGQDELRPDSYDGVTHWQSEDNIMAARMNEDTVDFVWNQCWKLSNTIIISNELAESKSSFMQYSEAEQLQLAEQFAQAAGVFMAFVLVAEEKGKEPSVVEKYKSYQDDFTQYGYQAGKLSGEFVTDEELIEFLEGLASLTVEQLTFYRIEPLRLHDAALQTVEDYEQENARNMQSCFGT